MSLKKTYLELTEINEILDNLKSNVDNEFDVAVLEDKLDDRKIVRLSAERVTIRRIRNLINQIMSNPEEDII